MGKRRAAKYQIANTEGQEVHKPEQPKAAYDEIVYENASFEEYYKVRRRPFVKINPLFAAKAYLSAAGFSMVKSCSVRHLREELPFEHQELCQKRRLTAASGDDV